jgi:hypothetical protein
MLALMVPFEMGRSRERQFVEQELRARLNVGRLGDTAQNGLHVLRENTKCLPSKLRVRFY